MKSDARVVERSRFPESRTASKAPPVPTKLPPLVWMVPPEIVPETATAPALTRSAFETLNDPEILSVADWLPTVRVPIANDSFLAILTVYMPEAAITAVADVPFGMPLGFQLAAAPQS